MNVRLVIVLVLGAILSQPAFAQWRVSSGQTAGGFKGPADFTVIPGAGGSLTVVVPDLVQSQLRFVQLRK